MQEVLVELRLLPKVIALEDLLDLNSGIRPLKNVHTQFLINEPHNKSLIFLGSKTYWNTFHSGKLYMFS